MLHAITLFAAADAADYAASLFRRLLARHALPHAAATLLAGVAC